MNCVITNGACYIKRNSENLLVATDSLGDALLQPAEKAQATMACLPRALQDKGFGVKSVSEILGSVESSMIPRSKETNKKNTITVFRLKRVRLYVI